MISELSSALNSDQNGQPVTLAATAGRTLPELKVAFDALIVQPLVRARWMHDCCVLVAPPRLIPVVRSKKVFPPKIALFRLLYVVRVGCRYRVLPLAPFFCMFSSDNAHFQVLEREE